MAIRIGFKWLLEIRKDKNTANVSRYINGYWSSSAVSISKFFERKMTSDEIEQEFSKIAKKLGYEPEVAIKGINSGKTLKINNIHISYHPDHDAVYLDFKKIYDRGQWAEIITPSELGNRFKVLWVMAEFAYYRKEFKQWIKEKGKKRHPKSQKNEYL